MFMASTSSRIFIFIAFIGVICFTILYFRTNNDRAALQEQLEQLVGQISQYVDQVSDLQIDVRDKMGEIDELVSDYQVLESRYSVLNDQYDVLRDDFDDLSYNYDLLSSSYVDLEYLYTMNTELRIGNSLTSYYDYLRYEFGPMGSRSFWSYEEESCKFASSLALHDLHRLYWIEAEEKYGTDVGQKSYDQAWTVLNKAVEYCEIEVNDSDTEKIKKVLTFVNELVDYELEIDDSLRAPVETLNLKSGDCDDFSILVAALLEAVDIQTGIGFFKSEDSAHAMVLVYLDDLEGYRCWYYDDLTDYDFEPGRWLIIEPQFTIWYQDIEDAMEEYELYMAVELDYEKVTS